MKNKKNKGKSIKFRKGLLSQLSKNIKRSNHYENKNKQRFKETTRLWI